VPADVRRKISFLLRDFVAVSVAGRRTPTAAIAADYAAAEHAGQAATSFFDSRRLGCTGAALANGVLANALDYDDGHRLTKGHPGSNVSPAAAAAADATDAPLDDLLAAIAVGYEVAIRAGIELHSRGGYHASGAWGGLGAAAACARLLHLQPEQLAHALGLAEYHAADAPIMRSVGEPAMTKDACAWGAFVGTTSALLASRGFTALSSTLLAAEDLGERWHVLDVYVKKYPCCRWSQPAIEAALALRAEHELDADRIGRVEIRGCAPLTGLFAGHPRTTEEAQYSVAWPVAVALERGDFGVADVLEPVGGVLTERTTVVVDPELDRLFPARRLVAVSVEAGGRWIRSEPFEARGEPDDPEWEALVDAKYRRHADDEILRRLAGDS
jgi:2-methylcitrate dehydratase PrpD